MSSEPSLRRLPAWAAAGAIRRTAASSSAVAIRAIAERELTEACARRHATRGWNRFTPAVSSGRGAACRAASSGRCASGGGAGGWASASACRRSPFWSLGPQTRPRGAAGLLDHREQVDAGWRGAHGASCLAEGAPPSAACRGSAAEASPPVGMLRTERLVKTAWRLNTVKNPEMPDASLGKRASPRLQSWSIPSPRDVLGAGMDIGAVIPAVSRPRKPVTVAI